MPKTIDLSKKKKKFDPEFYFGASRWEISFRKVKKKQDTKILFMV